MVIVIRFVLQLTLVPPRKTLDVAMECVLLHKIFAWTLRLTIVPPIRPCVLMAIVDLIQRLALLCLLRMVVLLDSSNVMMDLVKQHAHKHFVVLILILISVLAHVVRQPALGA